MQITTVSSPDIECDGCANAIKKALTSLPGIAEVAVDVPNKQVSITHQATVSHQTIVAALDRAGFSTAV